MTDRRVRIYEVGPRDGLQNEAAPIATADKLRFVALLAAAGLREIEATSFVSPRAIPQLADADELMRSLARDARRPLPGPRAEPARPRARRGAGADAIAVFTAASSSLHRAQHRHDRRRVARGVRAASSPGPRDRGWWRRAYVSTAFGCPYTGQVEPAAVVEVGRRLLDLGADEICFGDTIGVGVPDQVDGAHRGGRRGRDPARPDRATTSTTRAGTALANVAAGLADGRPLLRCRDGRHGRLSVRARRRRQPRHGGPRVPPRRVGLGARRPPRRRARGGPLRVRRCSAGRSRRRSARPAAGTRRRGPPPAASPDPARGGDTTPTPPARLLLSSRRWKVSYWS